LIASISPTKPMSRVWPDCPVRHGHFAGADQTAVLAGQADGLAAVVIDQHHDVLLHFAAQHPFHHFHGFFVGDTHALHEGALLADFFSALSICGPPPCTTTGSCPPA
jgi:hypothetical protein